MMGKKRGLALVVLAIFLLSFLLFSSADSDGCYVYPESGLYCTTVSQSEAETDCAEYSNCDMSNHFMTLRSCSDVDVCQLVVCDIDCEEKTLGECQKQGIDDTGVPGEGVSIEEHILSCTPGCCKLIPPTGENQCQYPLFERQCKDLAARRGFGWRHTASDDMTYSSCQQICTEEVVLSTLTITVINEEGAPVTTSTVKTLGTNSQTATNNGDGTYTFTALEPSIYVVKVEAENYKNGVASISVEGEGVSHQFILTSLVGERSISGTVTDETGQPINGAKVSIRDVKEETTTSSGTYTLSNIPPGIYTVTASLSGYATGSQQVTLSEDADATGIDFTLQEHVEQGVIVTVFFYVVPQTCASVYINDIFRGVTQFPSGKTNTIPLDIQEGGEDFEVFATFQDYDSEPVIFTISPGDTKSVDVHLRVPLTECNCEDPENMKLVEEFLVQPVLGKEQLKLSWTKPCPEVNNYVIERVEVGGEGTEEENTKFIPVSGAVTEYVDVHVEWGKTYAYSITAHYVGGVDGQCNSEPVSFGEITMGDAECESRYIEDAGWDHFCKSSDRTKIYTCNDQNKVEPAHGGDCGTGNLFCTQISQNAAMCSSNGMCSSGTVFGNPFGLYFKEDECYGTQTSPNYCYYDYTNTTVDKCSDCLDVESCFDYQSEGACTKNRCVGTICNWIDSASEPELADELIDYTPIYGNYNPAALFVTSETGAGYCVEENYEENDQCSLCDADSPLFENYYCTADVCTGLGKCFSNSDLTECHSCPDVPDSSHTCYNYVTEQECTGVHEISSDNGKITVSDDSCGWGRCFWLNEGGMGTCFKDGDVDGTDDCPVVLNDFGVSSYSNCIVDNMPPRTRISSADTLIISHETPELTFSGSDVHTEFGQTNALDTLSYCITAPAVDTCTIDKSINKFVEVAYSPNVDSEDLMVNIVDSGLLDANIDGKIRKIKYFSTDMFHNQESVQEDYIYVDTLKPQFTIHDKRTVNIDKVDLTVYLEDTNEPMSCEFTLEPVFGDSEVRTHSVSRSDNKKGAEFLNLLGTRYDVFVECTDDYGNTNEKNDSYVFNLDQRITIVRPLPEQVLASTSVVFEVRTGVAAVCELYNTATNQHVASFITSDGKTHTTSPVPGFSDGDYAAIYKAECTEQLENDVAEAYFDFMIDFTPPQTSITLQEGARTSSPTSFGWEEVFIEYVDVSLTCETDGGFGCAATHFCLGTGCDYAGNQNYQEYSEPFTIDTSTEICYYSTDTENNPFPEIMCGTIKIDGYGITLVSPEPHYYQNEVWGISNTPTFDWKFYTKVPTTTCAFDFRSGFDYDTVEPFKILSIIDGTYTFTKFPGDIISQYSNSGSIKTVYVQCKNEAGEIGPEYTMHLEYDPSAPEIESAYADPDNIIEGVSTDLFVETDDKTMCKYSDNSEDTGTKDYFAMEYSFPGTTENLIYTEHEDIFSINFLGTTKDYSLLTQCRNGAGDLSDVETIGFSVDYSVIGNILSISPQSGYFSASDMTIQVETNKNAVCEYELGNEYYAFTETGGRVHTFTLQGLEEGEYILPVRCMVGEHLAETSVTFTIDRTSPEIISVYDGNYTCGSTNINILVMTDEEVVVGYHYDLYDAGIVGGSGNASGSGPGGKVLEADVGPGMPINISTETLLENHTYYVELYTWDEAGNVGQPAQSDGIIVVNKNHSVCFVDTNAPVVTMLSLNLTSCTRVGVSLLCEDETSCSSFSYSQSYSSDSCTANMSYVSQNILFNRTGWVCYSASDPLDNSVSATKVVEFPDEDGDGIIDRCDLCPETGAGKIVDGEGCSSEQLSELEKTKDYDNDTLPDVWEKLYNSFTCDFNYKLNDSDSDGILDPDEDYDDDGKTSYEEYVADTDPCDASSVDDDEEATPSYPPYDSEDEDLDLVADYETEEPTDYPPSISEPTIPSEDNTLAFALLFIGLALVLGGVGYLVYYYKFSSTAGTRRSVAPVTERQVPARAEKVTWKDKLSFLRRKKAVRAKERSRKSLFGSFSKSSHEIPHVNEMLQKKAPHLSKVEALANRYVAHKDKIHPGLQSHEKGLFAKLESIAKKTKTKAIHEVVSKGEAKDIFEKLKKISKKRKGGK